MEVLGISGDARLEQAGAVRTEQPGFEPGPIHRGQVAAQAGIKVEYVKKIQQGHPNLLDFMADGDLQLVINTPSGKGARTDEGRIRAAAVSHGIPCITTIQAADAAVRAIEAMREEELEVEAVQDRFPTGKKPAAV